MCFRVKCAACIGRPDCIMRRPEILQRVASQHSASPEELEAYFENSGPSLQGDGSG